MYGAEPTKSQAEQLAFETGNHPFPDGTRKSDGSMTGGRTAAWLADCEVVYVSDVGKLVRVANLQSALLSKPRRNYMEWYQEICGKTTKDQTTA